MRYKKTQQRMTTETVSSRTTCDICGERANPSYLYDADKITIEAKLGEVYPEGDHRLVHEIDCCAKCFVEKVKPAIEALGAKFRVRGIEEDGLVEDWSEDL